MHKCSVVLSHVVSSLLCVAPCIPGRCRCLLLRAGWHDRAGVRNGGADVQSDQPVLTRDALGLELELEFGSELDLGLDLELQPPASCRGELAEATIRVVTEDKTIPVETLGKVISDQPDSRLNRIVSSMMSSTDSTRAQSLGLPVNPSLDTIIREYIQDFWKPQVI